MVRRILVVGGLEADRQLAQQALGCAGYQTDAVANGADAFEQLMAMPYDLIVTDCCLDKLECPALLQKVRGMGVKTPILVWTAVANNPALESVLKLTAGGYVDKAQQIEALAQQVDLVLNGGSPAAATPLPAAKAETAVAGGILLIDERPGEAEAFHALLPPSLHFASCESANQGLGHAHKHKFDLVLFSADTSITNLTGTIAQLHLLLPEGFVVGVATVVRGQEPQVALKALGGLDFDEVILKPFKSAGVSRLVDRYCSSWEHLVVVVDDVVRASSRCRRKDHYKDFVATLKGRLEQGVRSLIDACFDRAVVDLSMVDSLSPMDMAETLRRLKSVATPFGLTVRFVVTPALILVLRKFEASFGWDRFELYPSIEAARLAKA
jgi:CheY-like chemotaxis protein